MKNLLTILAVIVVVGVIFGAYYVGVHHVIAPVTSTSTAAANFSAPASSSYYTDVSTWQTSTESQAGFSIAYPLDFQINENMTATPSTDWRVGANGEPGVKVFTLTVPRTFEPQTNFVDATLTVGYSKSSQAIADCLRADMGSMTATSTATINSTLFKVFSSSDVGAGNIYKTTSYRAMHAGACYAVEYTVHSSELANYPASYGLTQYSDQTIDQVLDRVVGTFRFL
jgi:hypothetical protein